MPEALDTTAIEHTARQLLVTTSTSGSGTAASAELGAVVWATRQTGPRS